MVCRVLELEDEIIRAVPVRPRPRLSSALSTLPSTSPSALTNRDRLRLVRVVLIGLWFEIDEDGDDERCADNDRERVRDDERQRSEGDPVREPKDVADEQD